MEEVVRCFGSIALFNLANLSFFSLKTPCRTLFKRSHASRKGGSNTSLEHAGILSHESAALGTQAKADEAESFCPPLTSWAHESSHTPDPITPSHALATSNCTTACCVRGPFCDVRCRRATIVKSRRPQLHALPLNHTPQERSAERLLPSASAPTQCCFFPGPAA
jgi:hypothetical protein